MRVTSWYCSAMGAQEYIRHIKGITAKEIVLDMDGT